jgi:eight-cysteine-cluster-containing protein
VTVELDGAPRKVEAAMTEKTPERLTAVVEALQQISRSLESRGQDSCYIGGCSGQVCSDRNDIVTTCEWRDVYGCYRSARCEQQSDGACGWTPTPELNACLATHALTP